MDDRSASFVRRNADIALAVALALAAVLEAAAEPAGGQVPWLAALAGLPLAWRRRWPMAVLLAVFAGAAISRQAPYAEIVCATVAAYSVGAHEKHRVLGAAELVAVCVLVVLVFGGQLPSVPDFFGPFVVTVPLWLAGVAIRQARGRAQMLSEKAARIERERELSLRAAQAEERARIARDLHDVVAHSVSVMVVQAGAARHVLEQSPDKAAAALEAVEETGRVAMSELRQILGVLGDGEVPTDPQPGLEAVGGLVAAVREAGLPVEMRIDGAPNPVPPLVGLTAYRVIQEALTNAVRHSSMAPTSVRLGYRPEELSLEVFSDGPSSPSANGASGRGLTGMRERVALVGGRLEAGPCLERGFRVRAWLPTQLPP